MTWWDEQDEKIVDLEKRVESLEALVKSIKPDIMVVGSDWKDKSVIGSYWAADLKFYDRIEKYATSKAPHDHKDTHTKSALRLSVLP